MISHRTRLLMALGIVVAAAGLAAVAWAVDGAIWVGTAVPGDDGTRTFAGPSALYPNLEVFDGRTFTVTLTKQATGEGPYTITAQGRFATENDHPSEVYFVYTAENATITNAAGQMLCKHGTVAAGGAIHSSWVFQMTFPRNCAEFPGTQYVGVDGALSYRTDYARIWQAG